MDCHAKIFSKEYLKSLLKYCVYIKHVYTIEKTFALRTQQVAQRNFVVLTPVSGLCHITRKVLKMRITWFLRIGSLVVLDHFHESTFLIFNYYGYNNSHSISGGKRYDED